MTYSDIIKRLEESTGPDRALDARIAVALNDHPQRDGAVPYIGNTRQGTGPHNHDHWPDKVILKGEDGAEYVSSPYRYTASLDAAIALAERVWPGCLFIVKRGFTPSAMVWFLEQDRDEWPEYRGSTYSIALLLALFQALEAEGRS